jgi:hypothetical protein
MSGRIRSTPIKKGLDDISKRSQDTSLHSLKLTGKDNSMKNNVLKMVKPSIGASLVAAAFPNVQARSLVTQGDVNKASQQTWEELNEISEAIASQIGTIASEIHETTQLVRRYGCTHVREFNIAIEAANRDLNKFTDDFIKIREQHNTKHGIVRNNDDLSLCINLFENYQQFSAHLNGTMQHTLITFTEFALEAKDRAQAMLEKEETLATTEVKDI